jgi:group I intron endonuclease
MSKDNDQLIKIASEIDRPQDACLLYVITNSINIKVYVGQTWLSLKDRWKHGVGYKKCTAFYEAITEYGSDVFHYTILGAVLTQKDADYWENFFINEFRAIDPVYGYNMKHGGSTGRRTEALKKRLADARDTLERQAKDRAIADMYEDGAKIEDIGDAFDCGDTRIRVALKRLNIPTWVSIFETERENIAEDVKRMHIDEHKSMLEVASILGVSRNQAVVALSKLGLKPIPRSTQTILRDENWAITNDRIAELYANGAGVDAIVEELELSHRRVRRALKINDIPIRKRGNQTSPSLLTDDIQHRVAILYSENNSVADIAKILFLTYSEARSVMRKLQIRGFIARHSGGKRRNTPEEQTKLEQTVIDMYISGKGTTTIGRKLGWSQPAVMDMLRANNVPIRPKGTNATNIRPLAIE